MSCTYDDIYGVDLPTYCLTHDTTIEALIEKVEIDIRLLNERMKPLMEIYFMDQDGPLINHLHNLIHKKQKHKERLKSWA